MNGTVCMWMPATGTHTRACRNERRFSRSKAREITIFIVYHRLAHTLCQSQVGNREKFILALSAETRLAFKKKFKKIQLHLFFFISNSLLMTHSSHHSSLPCRQRLYWHLQFEIADDLRSHGHRLCTSKYFGSESAHWPQRWHYWYLMIWWFPFHWIIEKNHTYSIIINIKMTNRNLWNWRKKKHYAQLS